MLDEFFVAVPGRGAQQAASECTPGNSRPGSGPVLPNAALPTPQIKSGRESFSGYLWPAEAKAAQVRNGKTNWFQLAPQPLGAPREATVTQQRRGDQRVAKVSWHTAYAAENPIRQYEVLRDGQKICEVPHRPQTGKVPFSFEDNLKDQAAHGYRMVSVDSAGRRAETQELRIAGT